MVRLERFDRGNFAGGVLGGVGGSLIMLRARSQPRLLLRFEAGGSIHRGSSQPHGTTTGPRIVIGYALFQSSLLSLSLARALSRLGRLRKKGRDFIIRKSHSCGNTYYLHTYNVPLAGSNQLNLTILFEAESQAAGCARIYNPGFSWQHLT